MDFLVFFFLKLFIFWSILTIFEVAIVHSMEVSTFKYIKLLKFLEIFYEFSYQNNFSKITLFLNTSMV